MKHSKHALGAFITLFSIATYVIGIDDSTQRFLGEKYDSAAQSYKDLNKDPDNPFATGIGIADSQTGHHNNTVHPHYLAALLQGASQKASNPAQWLKEHWGYVVQSIPDAQCKSCNAQMRFNTLLPDKHEKTIDTITKIIAANRTAQSIAMAQCHQCGSSNIQQTPQQLVTCTDSQSQQMAQQVESLGSFKQDGVKKLPGYRLSIELADILKDNTDKTDPEKLTKTAQRLKDLHHPVTFMLHYANPQAKPNLFDNKADISWFAERCADIVRACPGLTHVCPISQIMGYGMQISRGALPPFETKLSQGEFLENIVQAQVQAGKAMKEVNPDVKVLVSHQWKPMSPKHGRLDPRYSLELLVSSIADYMYNQKFVSLIKPHIKEIDGIALSVYPRLEFNMWEPTSPNCSGIIDARAALEAIEKTAEAFPGKDIYIVETGCNNADGETKKKFVDMTLHACKIARSKGIPVKTCYFWGHSNKSYMEWNKAPGETNFGAFEDFSPDSINEYGKYLRDTVLPQK